MNNVTWLVPLADAEDFLEFPYDKLMAATSTANYFHSLVIPRIDANTPHERAVYKNEVIHNVVA